ncbi:MAG TPA: choice-of-anchor P family protein [Mycobacteriales bacterium]|nr:choice-of-anchor P family protein [Mycobacteriales bacterium]
MRLRRLAFAVFALTLLVPAEAASGLAARDTHGHVPVGSGLLSYTALANAPGIGITGIYMGVSLDIPQANSSLTTGGVGAGLASIAWPGDVGGNAGTAIQVLEPNAPSFVTILNDPVKAETHSTGTHHAVNKSIPGTVMESSATHTLVTASSKTSLALPTLGSLGAFTGSSSAKLVGPHTIRAVADSTLAGIKLAGGLIKIGALTSHAVVLSNGKTSHGHAKTTVADVTIAGIPVSIDKQGIHLAKSVIPTSAVTSLLSKTLKALHLSATFTPTLFSHAGPSASYDAGALLLTYHPGTGTTKYTLTLGRAMAQVGATASFAPGLVTGPTTSATTPPSTSSPGSSSPGGGGGSFPLPSGGASTVGTGGNVQPPTVASPVANAADDLAGGPTGWMIFGVIAAVLLGALFLPRIAGAFLAAPANSGCEDNE